jgi:hypothetical protein
MDRLLQSNKQVAKKYINKKEKKNRTRKNHREEKEESKSSIVKLIHKKYLCVK